jgi:hypothetical protein
MISCIIICKFKSGFCVCFWTILHLVIKKDGNMDM